MSDKQLLSLDEVRDWQQYWWSKRCNSVTIDQRKIYEDLYNAYVQLERLYINVTPSDYE